MKDLELIKKPIIFMSSSIIFSSIFYVLVDDYFWLAVLTANLFFFCIYLFTNFKFTLVIVLFFALGIASNVIYYNLEISKDYKGNVRIVKNGGYYYLGEIQGRVIYIENIKEEYKMYDVVQIEGEFRSCIDKRYGSIGTLKSRICRSKNGDFLTYLSEIREEIYQKLEENIGKRKSGLVCSLSFGYVDSLDSEDEEEMRNLGIIHAISVSGLHVALVYSALNKFRNKAISLIGTTIYVLLVGWMFSAVRSLIMICCLALSINCKKNYKPMAAISLSAMIITLYKPYAPFNLGFILSFSAVIGITLFSKKINYKLYKLPKNLRESIAITIAASVFTLPIIIYTFQEISVSTLIGNILIVPILTILIYIGNTLIIFLKVPLMFDFISFIILKIIEVLDFFMDMLYGMSNSYLINKSFVIVYVFLIISIYFVRRGFKKFYMLPIISAIVVAIGLYSPFMNIQYLREGGLLIAYRGERKIVTNKRNIEIAKLKKVNLVEEAFIEGENISISDDVQILKHGKNFILSIDEEKYYLKLNNKKEEEKEYDIIDFTSGNINGFYIINKKLIVY